MKKLFAWGGMLLLLALHLWRPAGTQLYFGWLPVDMAYRLAWMFLAWLYLMGFTTWVWREEG